MTLPPAARPDGDDGVTLIELLVTCVLTGLMAVIVATTVVGGLQTSARGERRTTESAQAQQAMLALTADVRASTGEVDHVPGFLSADPSGFSVNTRDTGSAGGTPQDTPQRVTWALVAGSLVQTRQALDPASLQPSGTPTTRTMLTGVLDPAAAGRPLFRYLSVSDAQSQCLSGPTRNASGTVPLQQIYAVDIWLSVSTSPNPSDRPLVVPGGAVVLNKGALPLSAANASSLGLGQGC